MNHVEVKRGDSPLVLALPHTGVDVPPDIFDRLTLLGQTLADTDWHIDRLYNGLVPAASTVRATFHRYVIDANRDPTGQSLYPGQNTTGLVPLTDFDGQNIWQDPPDGEEIEQRRQKFHAPYHAALSAELERVRKKHGIAILYDCHSIRSHIPFLFDGTLPDFNIGTNLGKTCATEIEVAIAEICAHAEGYTSITNGRFKGGWTTRHYGQPDKNIHAIQMELAQSTYLEAEAPPWSYSETKSDRLRTHLSTILKAIAALSVTLKP